MSTQGQKQIEAAFAAANWTEPTESQIEFAHGVGILLEQQLKLLHPSTTKEQGRREWARIVAGAFASLTATPSDDVRDALGKACEIIRAREAKIVREENTAGFDSQDIVEVIAEIRALGAPGGDCST